jgi:ribosomal protein S18 acetylase RimI-like enzyme
LNSNPIPLANPAWHALGFSQSHFNVGGEVLRYFPADVSPFVSLPNWDEAERELISTDLPEDRTFFVMLEPRVIIPDAFQVKVTLPLYQMVCDELKPAPSISNVQPPNDAHVPQMLELTALTRPGPFAQRTIEFGNYFGIFEGDQLVAMGGERLQVPGHTEVSAICTHPDFQGRQLATQILSHISQGILARGENPFLHTKTDNTAALRVYEKLGYRKSRDIFFAIIARQH